MKHYLELTKPGIVIGNCIPAIGTFFFASSESISWPLFTGMITGLALIVAGAGALNNYLDRDLDALMERTKTRPVPDGSISPYQALFFGIALNLCGVIVLFLTTNLLAMSMALLGMFVYIFLYTPAKRRTPHALFIGAVAGAMPPVVGYTAVTNTLDVSALVIFGFLFLWQLPHFLAIAINRYYEYSAAGMPLFITIPPTDEDRRKARRVFYSTLVILLLWSLTLILQR